MENVVWFESLDSTHAAALRLMAHMDSEDLALRPTLLVAGTQTTGVGRSRRRWLSPPGGLYLNWIAAGLSDEVVSCLPMLAAAAALSSIREIGVEGPGIKWPNDILVDGRKLAGLLVHARRAGITMVTVGLGVNLRPVGTLPDIPIQPPVSLDEIFGVETATEVALDLVVAFVRRLVGFVSDPAPALVLWREGLIHRQSDCLKVRLASGEELTGLFAGLTDEGFLRLEQDHGVRILTGGDIIES